MNKISHQMNTTPQPEVQKQIVAAFDFDGTITTRDSLLPFLFYIAGFWTSLKHLLLLSPYFLGFLINITSRQQVKEKVLTKFFGGMPINWIRQLGILFSKSNELDKIVLPSAKQRLAWHLQQGHRCILVSASIDVYLDPWRKKAGFHDLISSRLQVNAEGVFTGHLEGLNCWGPEKKRRLEELLGSRENYVLHAYGDGRGDKELLEMADFAYYRNMPTTTLNSTQRHEDTTAQRKE